MAGSVHTYRPRLCLPLGENCLHVCKPKSSSPEAAEKQHSAGRLTAKVLSLNLILAQKPPAKSVTS